MVVGLLTGFVPSGCGVEDARLQPVVVAIRAQPCGTPNGDLGVGVVAADGLVVTAAHTVDGALRRLTVDGQPATVTSIDARTDLAVLAAPDVAGDVQLATAPSLGPAVVIVAGGEHEVLITSTGPLVVHDVTDRTRHRREVHRFTPGVAPGTSGAPLVDDLGRVLGIAVLDGGSVAYAVTAAEVEALLLARPQVFPRPGDCAG